jgi:nitrite reductase (NO-forming)
MQAAANQINPRSSDSAAARLIIAAAAVRAAFGILMAIDAWLKWQPAFAAHYMGYLQNASNGQPQYLQPWFHLWLRLVVAHTGFFVTATRLIETAVATGLLLGLGRRITYMAGALFSLLIWSTAEGFGGPYTSGATNVGPALVYALIFIAAALFEHLLGSNPYSLDYYIERCYPKWASLVEWAPTRLLHPRPALEWDYQLGAIGAIFVVLVFALSTLGSAMRAVAPNSAECRRRRRTVEHRVRCAAGEYIAAGVAPAHQQRQHRRSHYDRERCDHSDRERRAISGVDV